MKTNFTASPSAHSVKPDAFYQLVHKYFKGKKLDVFARQKRIGFQVFVNAVKSYSLQRFAER